MSRVYKITELQFSKLSKVSKITNINNRKAVYQNNQGKFSDFYEANFCQIELTTILK